MIARISAVAVATMLVAAVAPAQQKYARRTTAIRAGMLVIDSAQTAGYPSNPTPHVLFNLDSNHRVKPADWSIVNPRAGTVVTNSINTRWSALLGGAAPAVGTTLTKAGAPYWEVYLRTATDGQLADYDLLVLSVRGYLSLQPVERERLRAFMDDGGTLWIDVADTTVIDALNTVPVAFDKAAGLAGPLDADVFHPLLSFPNGISLSQLESIQTDASAGLRAVDPANYGAGGLTPILAPLLNEYDRLHIVAEDTTGTLLGFARVGDGFMVATARGAATAINRVRQGGGYNSNTGFYGLPQLPDRAADVVASLIVNTIYLGTGYNQPFYGGRKQNSSPVDLHAPLLRTFQAPLALTPGTRNYVPPTTFKGLFVVSANDRLYVYDGKPALDRDGDGNPDDGIVDSDLAAGLDLLWISAPMAGPISSPACVDLPVTLVGVPRSQVLVVDTAGTVHAFDAFSTGANAAPAYSVASPGGAATFDLALDGRGPYAPTVHDGLVYIADTQTAVVGRAGRVWVLNPGSADSYRTSGVPWVVGGGATSLPEISGSPTVGEIPVQDNSGGQDIVAYVPTRPNAAAFGGPDSTAGVTSLWLGAKGERPVSVRDTGGGSIEVTTRASIAGLRIYSTVGSDPLGVKVSVFRTSTGNPLNATDMAALFTGGSVQGPDGVLTLNISGPWDPDYALRIDYRIDWGSGAITLTEQVRRGNLFFPDVERDRRVIGSVALSPNGNFFVVVSDQVRGGALYALREEGRGQFRMLYRYEMYDQHTINLNQTQAVQYAATILDEDGVTTMVPLLAGPMNTMTMQGSPAVRDGIVFVTATGQKGPFNIPMTVLMAFKANPEPVRIPVGNIPETFTLVQPDFARSTNPIIPEAYSLMQPTQFAYEQVGSTGTVRIENMMSSRTGIVQQALSSSQPIILRRSGQPDLLIEPDAIGGTWSPLLWYVVLHGGGNQSPPLVTGNTVFVAGNSKFPDILSGISPLLAVDRGVMFAMDADVNPIPPDAYPNSLRPWLRQVPTVRVSGPGIIPNRSILWPQTTGITSFEDWQVRYLQTTLRPTDTAFGIAGGDGALFAWGPTTLYGFTRGDLLIADEGRLLRLDASGNALWSSDTTSGAGSSAQSTQTATVKPLVRPVRAYRLGENEIVAADPGSNRIVRMNLAGKELRSITGFKLDGTYRPDGYQTGSPHTLNGASDVSVYASYVPLASNYLTLPNALEYWIYYLVADTVNKRLLEIVDRYVADPATREVLEPALDAAGARQLGILTWHSPSSVTGKDFRYNSVARIFNPMASNFLYAGGIGGTLPTRADLGLDTPAPTTIRQSSVGNGGVVIFDGASTQVVNEVTIPGIPANVMWDENLGSFATAGQSQRIVPMGNVSSVTMRYVTEGGFTRLAVMYTDSNGAYEIYQPTVGPTEPWFVRWMLPRGAYKVMRRTAGIPTIANARDLRATFARRLDSGEVIVVNGYVGRTRGNDDYFGEVVLLNGDFDPTNTNTIPGFSFAKTNFGFSSLSVRLQLADLDGVRDLRAPVFADLR